MAETIQFPGTMPDHTYVVSLRLSQIFDGVPTERLLTAIKVGRPDTQTFFRVRAGDAWRGNYALIQFGDDREMYIVAGALQAELAAEIRAVTLYTVINRTGTVRLWPINLPGPDGRDNEWFISARAVADIATTCWVRLQNNKSHWGA